jgi:hypothetical protein
MKRKTILIVITSIAGAGLIALAWWAYTLISTPLKFKAEREERTAVVVAKLKLIRTAERQYRANTGEFTDDWNKLTDFVLNGKNKYIYKHADPNDSTAYANYVEAWTKKNPGKKFQNEVEREYSIRDSLFKGMTDEEIKNLRYIPYTNNKVKFDLEAAVSSSGAPLVECRALYRHFLDTNKYRQEVINFIKDLEKKKDEYPGVKFGDITKSNNEAGNWEDD